MYSTFLQTIKRLFHRKIRRKDVIEYVEKELKIPLDHVSVNSKSRYYKIGDLSVRISDHLHPKATNDVGVTVIDGGVFVHIFDRIVTITSFKELKFFLWSFVTFYGNKQIEGVFQNTVDIFKNKLKTQDKLIKKYKTKIENQAGEVTRLRLVQDANREEIQNLKNQVVTLHKKNVYLNKVNPNKQQKKSQNLSSVRNKLKISDSVCEDLMEIIYKVSEHLDKLPEHLQNDILNYIGDYYDQK